MKHLNSRKCNAPHICFGSQQISVFFLVSHFPSGRLFSHFHDSVSNTFGDVKTKQCICIIYLLIFGNTSITFHKKKMGE